MGTLTGRVQGDVSTKAGVEGIVNAISAREQRVSAGGILMIIITSCCPVASLLWAR
jgi:hypothetical protein